MSKLKGAFSQNPESPKPKAALAEPPKLDSSNIFKVQKNASQEKSSKRTERYRDRIKKLVKKNLETKDNNENPITGETNTKRKCTKRNPDEVEPEKETDFETNPEEKKNEGDLNL